MLLCYVRVRVWAENDCAKETNWNLEARKTTIGRS